MRTGTGVAVTAAHVVGAAFLLWGLIGKGKPAAS